MKKILPILVASCLVLPAYADVGKKAGQKVNQAVDCAKEVKRGYTDARSNNQSGSGACYNTGQSAGKAVNAAGKEVKEFKEVVKKK